MSRYIAIALLFLIAALALAQTGIHGFIGYGDTPPASCTPGTAPTVWFDSDATAGENWLGCTSANTWTVLGGSSVRSESISISNPVTGHSGLIQLKLGAVTITEVCASTDTGTMTIQFDERAEATPNSAGTDVLTSALVADSDERCTTGFDNAAIAATAVMNLDIDAVASSPTQGRIHVFYSN